MDQIVIIESWLDKQSQPDILQILLEQYLDKCILWFEQQHHKSISKNGLMQSGLQFLDNVKNKEEFCVGLIRGFGSSLSNELLHQFSIQVYYRFSFLYASF